MRSQRNGGLSAITQVKVFSPEINIVAQGQGIHYPEARIAACVTGEHDGGVPGSQSMAGNRTVHIGTWESHVAPDGSFQQAGEARRRYGDMAVGLTHSRGVGGVMSVEFRASGTLEGVSGKTQRDAGIIH